MRKKGDKLPIIQPREYPDDIFLSPNECATTLRVHVSTIQRWISIGSLPAVGRDKIIRVRLSDLMELAPSYGSANRIAPEKRSGKAKLKNKPPAREPQPDVPRGTSELDS